MPTQPRTRRPRSRVITTLLYLFALPLLGASVCSLPFVAGIGWIVDLVADLSAQFLLLTFVVLIVAILVRRRGPAVMLLIACLFHAPTLMDRRVWWAPRGDDWSLPAPAGVIRFLHFNASSKKRAEDILAMIRASNADVVSITEPDWRLQSYVFTSDTIKDIYPYQLERHYDEAELGEGAGFVLSRFPIEPFDPAEAGVSMPSEFMAGFVTLPADRGGKRLGILAMHPRSPRTNARWITGNEVVEAAALIADEMQFGNVPVAILADFNSTPSGHRTARLKSETGFYRAKPLLRAAGTYPTTLFWPFTVAIDDAMLSPSLTVRSWRTGDNCGSDHWPVYIEIELRK